jgi:hypothetical protein
VADATVDLLVQITVTDGDADSDAEPIVHRIEKSITAAAEHVHRKGSIANAATRILWNPTVDTSEQIGTFRFLALWADGELQVELTTNEGHASEELSSFTIPANVPFLLGEDASFYGHAASDAFSGTADVIDKLRIKNASGATVKYNLVLVE